MPSILLIRPENRLADDIKICEQYGWTALPFAPMRLVANSEIGFRLPEKCTAADAVFWVSPSAVEIAAQLLLSPTCEGELEWGKWRGGSPPIHIAVGQSTARNLQNLNICTHVSELGNDSEAALNLPIWNTLPERAKILIIRGETGRNFLGNALIERGFFVEYLPLYRHEYLPLNWQTFQAAKIDAAWITSSKLARYVFTQTPPEFTQIRESLLYFTHHERIAESLHQLGATRIRIVPNLETIFLPHSHGDST